MSPRSFRTASKLDSTLSERVISFFQSVKLFGDDRGGPSFLCPAGIGRTPLCSVPCAQNVNAEQPQRDRRITPAAIAPPLEHETVRRKVRVLLATIGAGLAATRMTLGELGFFSHHDGAARTYSEWAEGEHRPLPQLIEGLRELRTELRFIRVAVVGSDEPPQATDPTLEEAVLELAEAQQLAEAAGDERSRLGAQRLRLANVDRMLVSPAKETGSLPLSSCLEARRWCLFVETILRRGRALSQAGPASLTSAPIMYPLISSPAIVLAEALFFAELVPHATSSELCLTIYALHHWLLAQGPGYDLLVWGSALPLTRKLSSVRDVLYIAINELDRRRARRSDAPRELAPEAATRDLLRRLAARVASREATLEIETARRQWLQAEALAASFGEPGPGGWRGSQAASAGACFRDRGTGLLRRSILPSLALLRENDPGALLLLHEHGPRALPSLAMFGDTFAAVLAEYVSQFVGEAPAESEGQARE